MILHYIKIALRKLSKSYIFASINIGGLVIALASAFLIFHFVLSELSTDHFHKNKNDIYRNIILLDDGEDEKMAISGSSYIMAENIHDKFPEIVNVCRIHSLDFNYGGQYILKDGEYFKTSNFTVVDENFFSMFSFKILYGNKNDLLSDYNSLLLSEAMAKKYFPGENPLGKTLRVENTKGVQSFIIKGVFKDFPANSTIKANFIAHIELSSDLYRSRGWQMSGTDTYIQLKANSDPHSFEDKLNKFTTDQHPNLPYTYQIQKLTSIYFDSGFLSYYFEPVGNFKLILIYSIIGFIILLIASINYIIITTASSTERMTEIGMRKVMGAKRFTIIKQMITESLLITFIALPLAIIVSEFALPTFNHLLGKELEINYFENWPYLVGIFLLTLFISLISGSYISVFVSAFSPEQIFKKRFTKQPSKFNFRKSLIAIQIIAFMVLFSFSSVIIKQINYMLDKKVGFNYKNIVNIIPPHHHDLYSCKAFSDELKKNPNIESVSEVNAGMYSSVFHEAGLANPNTPEEFIDFRFLQADDNYLQALKFNLIEGRAFDESMSSDTSSIILNKTAVLKLKLKDPIDKVLLDLSGERYLVIGVVDDFHLNSMHSLIPPMGIILKRHNSMVCQVLARIKPNNYSETIQFIEHAWNNYGPNSKFEYNFYENLVMEKYKDDKNFSDTIKILSILTVLIAAFGIFGFSYYNARQRMKEIGIRKVFGASISNIIKMIYKELGLLIGISGIIAIPISYLVCDNWLSNYAYRIEFPFWIFIFVFIVSIAIVFITTGITAYNAANKNPVDSLRYE